MNFEQGRINNYDWNEPVSKHLRIAYEALRQCIVNNFSPFPTYNPKMTIAKHRKTGRRPVAFINKDKESIGLGLAGGDGYWTDGSMSLKDLVNMWNKAQDAEEKHDDEDEEATAIAEYDWDAPIGENIDVATAALMNHVERVLANCGDPKKPIRLCWKCGAMPTVFIDDNGAIRYFGCRKEGHKRCYIGSLDTLNGILTEWNVEQKLDQEDGKPPKVKEHKETEMATTGEMIEKYDWNEPIANNRVLAADALEACIERNFPEKSMFDGAYMYGIPAKMEILRHRNSGEIPKVMKAEDGSNIGIGVEGLCYVWACPSETLTTLVDTWNKLQGKPIKETKEEPQEETSLDAMARNAVELDQKAKTIEELEAEADRGLSKPEDVQKLKEANVLTGSQKAIAEVCDEIKELLLEKNRKYGDSALNPCRIFARSDRLEQIRVRIDDKLNRIKNEQGDEDEDVVKDLIGYLVLYTVAQLHDFND